MKSTTLLILIWIIQIITIIVNIIWYYNPSELRCIELYKEWELTISRNCTSSIFKEYSKENKIKIDSFEKHDLKNILEHYYEWSYVQLKNKYCEKYETSEICL